MSRSHRPFLAPLRRLARDARGGPSIDFVLVFAPLAGLLIFAFQVGLSYFATLAAADGAERAARRAAVLPIAHCAALRNAEGERTHLLADQRDGVMPAAQAARVCLNDPSPCAPLPGKWTCSVTLDETGGLGAAASDCDAEVMARIAAAARAPGVSFGGLDVTWRDSRLGEAGGPVLPLITVTVHQAQLSLRNFMHDEIGPLTSVSSTVVGEAVGRGKWEGPSC